MKCDVPIRNKRRKITMAKKTRAERNFKFETLQLHVGQEQPDPVTDGSDLPDLFLCIQKLRACGSTFRTHRRRKYLRQADKPDRGCI